MRKESLELLYDHYKDTFVTIQTTISSREKNFIWAFLLIVVSLCLTLNPELGLDIFSDIGKNKLKVDIRPTYYAINSIILFTAIWFWIKYFQNVLHIEHLYKYVHKLEETLSSDNLVISREGKSYLSHYPLLKKIIHSFYTSFIPLLLISTIISKMYIEWFIESQKVPFFVRIVDSIGILFLISSTILYLSWIHFKDFKKS